MGRWSREEIERAFVRFQEVSAEAALSGDWDAWADLFVDDVEYVEHLYGEMRGRETVRAWITDTMSAYPGSEMTAFPVEWHVVDEDRGWVVMQVWNEMRDPGDGSRHAAYNFTLLKYAGDGMWAYEEDIYNPAHFGEMLEAWEAARDRADTGGAA